MFYGLYYDPTMLLVLPAVLLALYAQFRVQSTFRRYASVPSGRGESAARVAQMILSENGVTDVRVERVAGTLTDHYDPRENVLRLSDGVYGSSSIAALGVAAHEAGHVLQRYEGYAPLRAREAVLPVAKIGSYAAFPLFFLGMILSVEPLLWVGIIAFSAAVLFYLVTLPVEMNASSRAIAALEAGGHLTYEEARPARKVLNAAALTYIAAALQALLSLLRLLVLANNRRRD